MPMNNLVKFLLTTPGYIATNSPSVFVSVQYLLKTHALTAHKKAILNYQTYFTTASTS